MKFTILPFLPLILLVSGCAKSDWDSRWQETVSGGQFTAEELIVRVEGFLAEEPPLKYASEARFTLGFTWAEAEGLKNYTEARRWFEELLEQDPNCEWADDARWMLENMEKDVDEILPWLEQMQQEQQSEPPPC